MTRWVFGQAAVDLLDHVHGQHRAVGLARELVGAVAGAHGDGQRIDLGVVDEVHGLVGIGQQLVVAELALDAVAVFLLAACRISSEPSTPSSPSTETPTQWAMSTTRRVTPDVVVVVGRRLAVVLQRAVHHHAR